MELDQPTPPTEFSVNQIPCKLSKISMLIQEECSKFDYLVVVHAGRPVANVGSTPPQRSYPRPDRGDPPSIHLHMTTDAIPMTAQQRLDLPNADTASPLTVPGLHVTVSHVGVGEVEARVLKPPHSGVVIVVRGHDELLGILHDGPLGRRLDPGESPVSIR